MIKGLSTIQAIYSTFAIEMYIYILRDSSMSYKEYSKGIFRFSHLLIRGYIKIQVLIRLFMALFGLIFYLLVFLKKCIPGSIVYFVLLFLVSVMKLNENTCPNKYRFNQPLIFLDHERRKSQVVRLVWPSNMAITQAVLQAFSILCKVQALQSGNSNKEPPTLFIHVKWKSYFGKMF